MFSEIHFTCQLLKFSAFTNSWHVPPPLASSSRLSPPPRHLKDATPAPEMYTHVRPAPPPKKNLLPYPLKGWCTEQGDRSSPLIPFYPSGFSNKCAPQAFNLWPLHLPAPQSCKKKKKKKAPEISEQSWHMLSCHVFLSLLPPLSLSPSLSVSTHELRRLWVTECYDYETGRELR